MSALTNSTQEWAREANEKLAMLTVRRMQVRAGIAILSLLFAVAATALTIVLKEGPVFYALFAFASITLFLIFGVLFLDAYGHWREIRSRNWKSTTPRFDQRKPIEAVAPMATQGTETGTT